MTAIEKRPPAAKCLTHDVDMQGLSCPSCYAENKAKFDAWAKTVNFVAYSGGGPRHYNSMTVRVDGEEVVTYHDLDDDDGLPPHISTEVNALIDTRMAEFRATCRCLACLRARGEVAQ